MPGDPGVLARAPCRAPFSSRASAWYRMSLTSVDLPEPDTPVTATRQPSGNATSTPRRLCSRAPLTDDLTALVPARRAARAPGWPAGRTGRRRSATPRLASRSATVPVTTMWPPCSPGPRPDVDHPVGGPDRVLVVLDDDQRVAQVAQPEQRLEQPVVVPLVQPDATARRARTARRPGRSRSGWPAGSAAPRRRPAWPTPGPGSGSPGPRRAGSRSRALTSLRIRAGDLPCRARTAPASSSRLASSPIGSAQSSAIDLPSTVTASDDRLEPGALAGRARHLAHEARRTSPGSSRTPPRRAAARRTGSRPRSWCSTSAPGRTGSCTGRAPAGRSPRSSALRASAGSLRPRRVDAEPDASRRGPRSAGSK